MIPNTKRNKLLATLPIEGSQPLRWRHALPPIRRPQQPVDQNTAAADRPQPRGARP